jgi:hypothetical protein
MKNLPVIGCWYRGSSEVFLEYYRISGSCLFLGRVVGGSGVCRRVASWAWHPTGIVIKSMCLINRN